jgi:beta-xylosidase
VFAADPEGHQWKDGRLYLYVSRDESPDFYCSWRYDLLSTDDLKNWTIHRDAFASKGPNDEVPYSDGELYASDAAYKDGKYYLYYSMRDAIDEGVAVADAPVRSVTADLLRESLRSTRPFSSTTTGRLISIGDSSRPRAPS